MVATRRRAVINNESGMTRRMVSEFMPEQSVPVTPVGNIAMDMKIGMADLKAVVISEWQNRLSLSRTKLESYQVEAGAIIAALKRTLCDQVQAQTGQYLQTDPRIAEMTRVLCSWLDKTVVTVFVRVGWNADYGYGTNKQNTAEERAPRVDGVLGMIVGEVQFYTSIEIKRSDKIDDLSVERSIPISSEIRQTLDALQKAIEDQNKLANDLLSVNKLMAESAKRGEHVHASLTKAYLQGEIKETADILRVMQTSMTRNLGLPQHITQLLLESTPVGD